MNSDGWYILIYQTPDLTAQDNLVEGLRGLGHMVVQTEQDRGEYFVIAECEDTTPAITLHELAMAIDANAVLVGTHTGSLASDMHRILEPHG